MLRLLTIELQKIKYSKSAKALLIIYFGLFMFIALIASIKFNLGFVEFHLAEQGIFNFPYIWHFNTYIASFLKIFMAVIIVSMVANEYSNRTLKQNLIDGLSKKEFILSKFYTVILFALASTLFIFLVSFVLGLIFSSYTEFSIIFSDLEYLFAYFIKLVGFFAFCLFLGIWIKRSAFALGFLFVWWIAESIIIGVLKFVIFKDSLIANKISQFLPLESISNLVKQPFTRLNVVQASASQIGADVNWDSSVSILQLLIVCVWTGIFIFLSYKIIKRRDL
ncbi:ABC-type transport system involved in multi-copper enzyme maturation permease subunit [Mesonia hippocampi]|uniref:ABC-type transport system involved in multi-copper enzyme maturation permease subunit n=1 Tax=Mesonia hippocampi TaxID=1628250 RepID=A0A840EIV2_9FLAO|nr:ABC transporter permease [Mesonia hippocampi]MBB4118088.1 ABC-type transport system involved in multi-copper enzyme maturation permease subunit [Mesonia hippocampi]